MTHDYWRPGRVRVKFHGVTPRVRSRLNTIDEDRAQREQMVANIGSDSLSSRMALQCALLLARSVDERGTLDDTCRLANILTMVVADAVERGDETRRDLHAGELLAVLSDIADQGDEEMAIAINQVMPGLDEHVRGFGKAWVHRRRAE